MCTRAVAYTYTRTPVEPLGSTATVSTSMAPVGTSVTYDRPSTARVQPVEVLIDTIPPVDVDTAIDSVPSDECTHADAAPGSAFVLGPPKPVSSATQPTTPKHTAKATDSAAYRAIFSPDRVSDASTDKIWAVEQVIIDETI